MRPLIILLKTFFMAACAVLLFGLISRYLRHLDPFIPIDLPKRLSYLGGAFMAAGAALAFTCFGLFARQGALTPGATFPDPNTFVSRGPYRYVRNPMAVGSLTFLTGWALVERSPSILLLAIAMTGLMHLLVVFVEEPKLERRFGPSYRAYKDRIPRWLPTRPAASPR